MTIKLVESFQTGDPVPSWLLDREPSVGPETSQPGSFVFGCDCHIVETTGGFVLVPDRPRFEFLLRSIGTGVALMATNRPVSVPSRFVTLYPKGDPSQPSSARTIRMGKGKP